jgi:acetolactate synthase-1/2/3 large subunit
MKECGVEYFFIGGGGALVSAYPSIEKAGVKIVMCHNEKAATNMADGYARVTKKPTFCYGQHGAAAHILASMLYEPMYAHSPVIAITPTILARDRFQYQECYEMKYFDETCKFNVEVTDPSRLAEYVRTAIQIAVSGCPGPTHLNLRIGMRGGKEVEMPDIYGDKTFLKVPPFRPRAEAERVAEAAKLLADAQRPVMMCGSGVHLSGAYDEVKALAELLSIPVITNHPGKGCFPEDHPLYVGITGRYGATLANKVVRDADLVFFVANRAGGHTTANLQVPEPGAAKIIHLDIDPMAIGRNYKPDVPLLGDAKKTLQELLSVLKTMIAKPTPKGQRLQELAKSKKEYESLVGPMMESNAIPIKPQRLMKEISKFLRARDILVCDTAQAMCWTGTFVKLKGTGVTYLPCGGTLGSSLGLAIGASFGAGKDQRVIHLTGDGGMGYNLADLETALRYDDQHAPFVCVVNDNASYSQTRLASGFEDWTKSEAPRYHYFEFTPINYAKVAEAFGCCGIRVEKAGEIGDALQAAFDSGKTAVVDVVTDKREYFPTLRGGLFGESGGVTPGAAQQEKTG